MDLLAVFLNCMRPFFCCLHLLQFICVVGQQLVRQVVWVYEFEYMMY